MFKSLRAVNGGGYGVRDYLDPRLLISIPVAVSRYVYAAVKHRSMVCFFLILLLIQQYTSTAVGVLSEIGPQTAKASNIAGSMILTLTGVLSFVSLRPMITVLLDERNHVLAQNIYKECQKAGDGEVVVAVLGMAHCSGVKKLLLRSFEQSAQ